MPGDDSTLASRALVFTLCAAIALSTLAYGAVHSWALAIFQAGAALVVLLWVVDAMQSGVLRVSRSLIQVPLIGLLCIATVQLLPLGSTGDNATRAAISYDPHATLLVAIKTLALFVYFAAALAFIDSSQRLRSVVRFVTVFGFLIAILGLVQAFVSPDKIYGIREPLQAAPFGPFVNRHHFAAFMELSLALPLGLLFTGAIESDRRLLYGFAALMMAIALVMTGSRGAMLSLMVLIVFVMIVSASARAEKESSSRESGRSKFGIDAGWMKRAIAAVALGIGLLIGVQVFGGEDAILRLVDSVNSSDPTNGRTHFWATTLGMIRDHPLLGVGLGAYSLAYTRYDTQGGVMRLEQAHNDYLQVLADTGILGGALGVLFLVVLFRRAWRAIRSKDRFRRGVALGALAGCLSVLVHSIFEFALHTTANALLFLVIVALATLGSQVEKSPSPNRRRRRDRKSTSSSSDVSNDAPVGGVVAHTISHDAVASS
jgi:O-antigen ligase